MIDFQIKPRGFLDKVSDRIVKFQSSWTNMTLTTGLIIVWAVVNSVWLKKRPFDPYPFIFLNLLLSFLAAFQNIVILMSTSRLEQIDREVAKENYLLSVSTDETIKEILMHMAKERELTDHLIEYMNQRKEVDHKILLYLEQFNNAPEANSNGKSNGKLEE